MPLPPAVARLDPAAAGCGPGAPLAGLATGRDGGHACRAGAGRRRWPHTGTGSTGLGRGVVQQAAAEQRAADKRRAARGRGARPRVLAVQQVPGQRVPGQRVLPGQQRAVQPNRRGRVEWPRESTGPQRAGPLPDGQPPGSGTGRRVGDQPEHPVPQRGRQRGHRQRAQQHVRREFTALPVTADGAAPDVQADPLAQQHGQPAVPAGQHRVQFGAGVPPGAGHQQHAQRRLEVGPGPGRHYVRLVARHPEGIGQVGAVQLVTQAQLDDLPRGLG